MSSFQIYYGRAGCIFYVNILLLLLLLPLSWMRIISHARGVLRIFNKGGGADSRILLCKRMHSLSKYTVAIVATVLDVHFILRQGRTKDFLLGAWNFQISTMGTYENTSSYNCPHIQTIDTYRGFFTKMEGGGVNSWNPPERRIMGLLTPPHFSFVQCTTHIVDATLKVLCLNLPLFIPF